MEIGISFYLFEYNLFTLTYYYKLAVYTLVIANIYTFRLNEFWKKNEDKNNNNIIYSKNNHF